MNKYFCIKKLIKHIYEELRRVMRNTKYENSWVFYHDELSLMTSIDRIKLIREKVIYKHWLLP